VRREQTKTKQLHTRSQRGFTLLELLLAMGVLLLIVVFSAGALSMGSRSVAQGDARMEYLERLRMSLSTIRAQIESQIPLRIEEEGTKRYAFKGDGKTLQLATGYSAWGSEKGPVIVTYRVEDDGQGRQVLRVSEVLSGTEAKREAVLLEASEITFEYEMPNPADPAAQWSEKWTETDIIPVRVRMRLADGKRLFVLVIPTHSQGVMMPTGVNLATQDTSRGLPK
jgi:prepilin-type N-terminal cleavage/methylation domain-containing protein